jgi:hypothetical protein
MDIIYNTGLGRPPATRAPARLSVRDRCKCFNCLASLLSTSSFPLSSSFSPLSSLSSSVIGHRLSFVLASAKAPTPAPIFRAILFPLPSPTCAALPRQIKILWDDWTFFKTLFHCVFVGVVTVFLFSYLCILIGIYMHQVYIATHVAVLVSPYYPDLYIQTDRDQYQVPIILSKREK